MKEWLLEYFIIPRKERVGIMALLVMLSMVWLIPFLWKVANKTDAAFYAARANSVSTGSAIPVIKLQSFDPNTIDDNEWLSMGVPEQTVHMIRNYLNKGGRFRKPEALMSIYGIDTSIAKKLIPYVVINVETKASYNKPHVNLDVSTIDPRFRKTAETRPTILDINTADSAELETLPWIGAKTASRIVKYREACGGFYAVDQLAGIYGISDTAFLHFRPYLKISKKNLRLLKVNEDSLQTLSRHPYIQFRQAKALIAYRNEHGPFNNKQDLLAIPMFDQAWVDKIEPYLRF